MQSQKPYSSTEKAFEKNSLTIRPSIDSDLEGMIAMSCAIHDELCPRLTAWYHKHPEAFEAEFQGPKGQDATKRVFYTIENQQGVIVGSGGLVQKSPRHEPLTGEISKIYLLPEFRGKGLGRAIMDDLIKKAHSVGFKKLFLTTRKEFVAATNLYQSMGFYQVDNKKYKSSNSTAWEMIIE